MTSQHRFASFLAALIVVLIGLTAAQAQLSRVWVERHVMRSIRQIQSAQATYNATTGSGSYGTLANLRQAGLIDEALASGDKYGYVFVVTIATGPSRFNATATPRVYRKTGTRSFYTDSSDSEIRGGDKNGSPATSTDPIIDDCTSGTIIENEGCTIQDIRILISAQMTYQATVGNPNYGFLDDLRAAGLIRSGLGGGITRGYAYTVQVIDYVPETQAASFKIWATPFNYGSTGIRSFYTDQTGVIRGADRNGAPAGPTDPPIE